MATQPNTMPIPNIADEQPERQLTYDEWWDLMESLFGSAKQAYAEYGGSDAFMAAERAAWDEDAPAFEENVQR